MRGLHYTKEYLVTADLGFSQDYTALSVLERSEKLTGLERKQWDEDEKTYVLQEEWKGSYKLNWLERPPLKTPYPTIVDRIATLMMHPKLMGNATLIVDATGVGRPVVQMMQDQGLSPVPVLVTGGQNETLDEDGIYHVPKKVIVTSLQVVLQERRITMAQRLPLVETLLQELDNFKMKQSATTGNISYEAWRAKDHDDLVFAVGLGAWYGETQSSSRQWRTKVLNAQDPMTLSLLSQSMERRIEEEHVGSDDDGFGKVIPFRTPTSRSPFSFRR